MVARDRHERMSQQLKDEIRALWREAKPRLRRAAVHLLALLREVWAWLKPPLLFVLQVAAALVVIFEEWGWQPLSDALARLARFRPWAALERWIAGLPPYGALTVFALPTAILLPIKFAAVYLLANGMVVTAGALFVGAKIASTALIARIFVLTKPALMRIGWFARAYGWFMPWKEALFAALRASWAWRYGRMVKNTVRHEAKQAWARWKPALAKAWAEARPRLVAAAEKARTQARLLAVAGRAAARRALARARAGVRGLYRRVSGLGL